MTLGIQGHGLRAEPCNAANAANAMCCATPFPPQLLLQRAATATTAGLGHLAQPVLVGAECGAAPPSSIGGALSPGRLGFCSRLRYIALARVPTSDIQIRESLPPTGQQRSAGTVPHTPDAASLTKHCPPAAHPKLGQQGGPGPPHNALPSCRSIDRSASP